MPPEGVSAEAGGEDRNVSVDDLHRAAEETKETETEKPSGEEQAITPDSEPAEEPTDNASRTKLGMKVAAQERLIEKMSGQLAQVTNIITWFAQQAQELPKKQTGAEEEIPEYIPTETKEFLSFMEKRDQQRQQQAQTEVAQFAQKYVGVVNELAASEDDPAIGAEIVKLTTVPGALFNKRYSNDAAADADRNFNKAKVHILKERIAKGKEPENPLKGGEPTAPLGGSSTAGAKKTPKTIELDEYGKRAAAAFGLTGKALEDALRE